MDRVVAVGAHCDDIAIGAGGTLLTLCRDHPGLRVDALVCSGAGTEREVEEHAALAACCPDAKLDVTVLDLPDGRFPAHWAPLKDAVEDLRRRADPDLVLAPHTGDAHQDHRTLAEIVPSTFRDQLILGYEIPKWDSDLRQPSVFRPLSVEIAHAKAELLVEHYRSQRGRDWFDQETFLGLARVRGVQCRARYAEAFHATKIVLGD
ncbi:MAG TPA: PIG-L deacetylase family protein [Pseudonocardiaceae bacterium]|jgi:LmbE family N-acetylglucosaminyl deacetylase|nr:PIG-L deacetylase family protein [Pseudonocardiaceae bacterium]